jgi:hypothetical protein
MIRDRLVMVSSRLPVTASCSDGTVSLEPSPGWRARKDGRPMHRRDPLFAELLRYGTETELGRLAESRDRHREATSVVDKSTAILTLSAVG